MKYLLGCLLYPRFLVVFSTLGMLVSYGGLYAQDSSLAAFLRLNNAPWHHKAKQPVLFDKAFYRSQLFLFGEIHGSAQPQQTDLALFTHLHRRAGVRYYIAEVDYSKAWLLNRYLASGDSTLLDAVFASWKKDTAQWANQEHYQKWQGLRLLQRNAGKRQRFRVVGIDVPQDLPLLALHLQWLAKAKQLQQLQPVMDSLVLLAATNQRKLLVAYAKVIWPQLQQQEAAWMQAMQADFPAFRHLVQVLNWLDAGNNRDKVMFLNFQAQVRQNGALAQQKMYGFLGFFHCLQTGYNNNTPFAAWLRQDSVLPGPLVTLAMMTVDSKTLLPYSGIARQLVPFNKAQQLWKEAPPFGISQKYVPYDLNNKLPVMKIEGIGLLEALSQPSSVHLFRLSGTGTPFAHSRLLAEVSGFQPLKLTNGAAHTLDAFQYILLFRNSAAAIPL